MSRRVPYTVHFLPSAWQSLLEAPVSVRGQLLDAISDLADHPNPPECLPMTGKGQGMHRMKIATYRVVYRVRPNKRIVLILRIGHRNEVYRGLES